MKTKHNPESAFSLVEVVLALAVAAFSLVTVFGLLPVGINSNQNSIRQTAAANFAKSIIADLRATQTNTPRANTSTVFNIPIPTAGSGNATHTLFLREDGTTGTTAVDANADPSQNPRYRITLYFYPPTSSSGKSATTARVLITWPALADQTASLVPTKFTGSYETSTALNRN